MTLIQELEELKESLEKKQKARDKAFDDLKYSLDIGLITEEQYYKDLETLRDAYFEKGTDEWRDYTLEICNYQKEQVKSAYDEISKYADDTIGAVTSAQEAMKSKLGDIGGLTQSINVAGLGEYEVLTDITKRNQAIQSYIDELERLKEKLKETGADEDVIKGIMSELEGMEIGDARKSMRAFLGAPVQSLKDYTEAYAESLRLSEQLSAGYYKEDFEEAVDKSVKYAEDKLKDFGFDVPKDFFTSGSESAKQFGQAFSDELDRQISDIRAKIEGFNASLGYSISEGAGNVMNNYNNTTYNTTYNLENSGGTVESGLAAANRQEVLNRHRYG